MASPRAVTGEYRSVNLLVHGSLRAPLLRSRSPPSRRSLLMTLFAIVDAFWVGTRIGAARARRGVDVDLLGVDAHLVRRDGRASASRRSRHAGMGSGARGGGARGRGDALFSLVALAILLAGVGTRASRHALRRSCTRRPRSRRSASDYLGTYLFGAPLIFGFFAIDAAFRAAGDTRTPFVLLLGVASSSRSCSTRCSSSGSARCRELGIAGAAVATIFTRCVAFLDRHRDCSCGAAC